MFCLLSEPKSGSQTHMSVTVHIYHILVSVLCLHLLYDALFYSGSKISDAESMLSLSVSKTRGLFHMCVVAPRHLIKTILPALLSKHRQADYVSLCSKPNIPLPCAAFLFPQILAGLQHVVCLLFSISLKLTEYSSMGARFLPISTNINISSFFGSSKLYEQEVHVFLLESAGYKLPCAR
jgi:hypothetical protein